MPDGSTNESINRYLAAAGIPAVAIAWHKHKGLSKAYLVGSPGPITKERWTSEQGEILLQAAGNQQQQQEQAYVSFVSAGRVDGITANSRTGMAPQHIEEIQEEGASPPAMGPVKQAVASTNRMTDLESRLSNLEAQHVGHTKKIATLTSEVGEVKSMAQATAATVSTLRQDITNDIAALLRTELKGGQRPAGANA